MTTRRRSGLPVTLALAAALAACTAAPEPSPTGGTAPAQLVPASPVAAAPSGGPRTCAQVEAEMSDTSEVMGAVAAAQAGQRAGIATSVGTSFMLAAAGSNPATAIAADVARQGIQAGQRAAQRAQVAAVQAAAGRMMERHQHLLADYVALGCGGDAPIAPVTDGD